MLRIGVGKCLGVGRARFLDLALRCEDVTTPVREHVLRTMGRIAKVEDFGDIPVAVVNGSPLRLKDVATIEDGTREQRTLARLNGKPSVTLEVRRQSGANTIEVIEGVKAELEKARAQLPPGVDVQIIEDQSRYIYAALHEIDTHLILGSVLACLVVLGTNPPAIDSECRDERFESTRVNELNMCRRFNSVSGRLGISVV